MNNEEIEEVITELAALQIRQAQLIERLESIRAREEQNRAREEQNRRDQAAQNLPEGLVADVGDTVRFTHTRTTSGGEGIVVGFTRGWNPFARIRRTTGPFVGEIVKRKTINLTVLHRPRLNAN